MCLTHTAWRWGSFSYFAPAVLALVAIGFMVVRTDLDERRRFEDNQRAVVTEQLERLSASLQSNINGNVKLAQGLAAAVGAESALDQARFAQLCADLLGGKSQIRSIAAAPDLVLRFVFPEEPNRKAIGLDFRKNPQQRAAALEVLRTGNPLIAGPVDLVQGGSGLVVRYPVFARQDDGSRRFWGLVSAVMDLHELYADSGLLAPDAPVEVTISRKRPEGGESVFFGNPRLAKRKPVRIKLDLGYDVWMLAAAPKGGWASAGPKLLESRIFSFLVAAAVAGPFLWVGYLLRQRQSHILALREREDKLEALSHRLQLALEASKAGVWEFDAATGELNWDARMREIYSVPPEKPAVEYEDWRRALHPDDLAEAERTFARALAGETAYVTEFRVVTPSGQVRCIQAFGQTYRTHGGAPRIVGANTDVTEDVQMKEDLKRARAQAETQNQRLEEARRRLEHQSVHDVLTGLPNRRYLDLYLERPRAETPHVLAHVDLDRFKEVNDLFGHATGDAVLRQAAERMRAVLSGEEFAARIGGDEFVVVAPTGEPDARSRELGEALLAAFAAPMVVNGFECRVGASVGLAIQAAPEPDLRPLLVNADLALYKAKQLGRNRFEVFDEALRLSAAAERRSADEFLAALDRVEFVPYFQPQFDAHTLELVGVEALARWDHPTRGLLAPDKFLPLAENLNKVYEIDAIIFEKAFFQSARWAAGDRRVKLSVNISAQRLRDERLARRLSDLHVPAGLLAFELLESISFDGHDEELLDAIRKLKQLGVEIEIDDFGSGHASIASLLEIAPSRLKIDRKIVAPVVNSKSHQRLVAAIVEIGRSFDIEITAEGVETMAHARILRDLGCHTLQGYAFARPMSAADLNDFLRSYPRRRWREEVALCV